MKYTHARARAHTHKLTQARNLTHTCTQARTHTPACKHKHAMASKNARTRTHTHTHTRTHARTDSLHTQQDQLLLFQLERKITLQVNFDHYCNTLMSSFFRKGNTGGFLTHTKIPISMYIVYTQKNRQLRTFVFLSCAYRFFP